MKKCKGRQRQLALASLSFNFGHWSFDFGGKWGWGTCPLHIALGVPKGPPRPGACSPRRAQYRSFHLVGRFSLRPGVP